MLTKRFFQTLVLTAAVNIALLLICFGMCPAYGR